MNAIAALMDTVVRRSKPQKPCIFVLGDEFYSDTYRIPKFLQKEGKRTHLQIEELKNVQESEKIIEMFKQYKHHIKLLFLESCSNPSGQVFDFSIVTELKKWANGCIVCVDNTWTSGASFNPFDYGVDVVIESMTKYISGGQRIGGMMIGPKKLMNQTRVWEKVFGQHVSDSYCRVFSQGLDTVHDRLQQSGAVAKQVAGFLERHPRVNRVMHPSLPSHPTHKIAIQFFKFPTSIVWFHVSDRTGRPLDQHKKALAYGLKKFGDALRFETSYGSWYSKIDPWPTVAHSKMYEGSIRDDECECTSLAVPGIWLRLSVGYGEYAARLCKDLELMLDSFSE